MPIPTRDDTSTFGLVSRLNHSLVGVGVVALLAIGLYFHEMPRGDEKTFWKGLHISLGGLFALPILWRVGWRLFEGRPTDLPQDARMQRLAKIVHGVLLLAMVILAVSGPLIPWTVERPIDVFGVAIASPLPKMRELHEALEEVHAVTSRVLLVALLLHVAGIVRYALHSASALIERMGWRGPTSS